MGPGQISCGGAQSSPATPGPLRPALLGLALLALAACSGGNSAAPSTPPAPSTTPGVPPVTSVSLVVSVIDMDRSPVADASIAVSAGTEATRTATSNGKGEAVFADLPTGTAQVSIRADGFDPVDYPTQLTASNPRGNFTSVYLRATLGWMLGPVARLGAEVANLSADGSSARVTVDVAVLRDGTGPITTLTTADFSVLELDCGSFGVALQCAADASGQLTGENGRFRAEGPADPFALQMPAARTNYAAGFLAELGSATLDWSRSRSVLEGFFTALRAPDAATLATYHRDADATTLTTLGPLASDGSAYAAAIGRIDPRSGARVNPRSAIDDFVRTSLASGAGLQQGAATHLIMYGPWHVYMDASERAATLKQMGDNGLRFSVIAGTDEGATGVLDIVARTRGLIVEVKDARQLPTLASALDGLFAGTIPHYRMTFTLKGAAGTFVSGGTIGGLLRIRVPDFKPAESLYTRFAAAIP
jgi:hypothetical protein